LEKWYIHFPFLQETEGNPGLGLSLLKMMRKAENGTGNGTGTACVELAAEVSGSQAPGQQMDLAKDNATRSKLADLLVALNKGKNVDPAD
jgi:hypothetical protein